MIRLAIARPIALRSAPLSASVAARCLFSTSPRALAAELPPKTSQPGSEGLHNRDVPATTPRQPEPGTGDWVLFHPVYTKAEVHAFKDVRHKAKTMSDHVANIFVWMLRQGFDLASRYKHKDIPPESEMTLAKLRAGGYTMDAHGWLNRILFLESIAGVPGFVAATCRHLRSLRLMRRDSGWIHTLLEEAENERMHLMTFMSLRNPGIFFRALILGAQGVFYNIFFFSYLISPKTAHRFVGLLEEQACWTYTNCIADLEAGHLPEWADMPAPAIAIDYWRLSPDAKMIDVLYAVRADETTHRFVNHTLSNLDPKTDANPFALREPDMHVKGVMPGFSKEQAEEYARESHRLIIENATTQDPYATAPTSVPEAPKPEAKPAGQSS